METFATARLPHTSSCCSSTFPSRRRAAGKNLSNRCLNIMTKKKNCRGESTDRGWNLRAKLLRSSAAESAHKEIGSCLIFDVLVPNEKEAAFPIKKLVFHLFSTKFLWNCSFQKLCQKCISRWRPFFTSLTCPVIHIRSAICFFYSIEFWNAIDLQSPRFTFLKLKLNWFRQRQKEEK